jgi:uncharacterized protein YegP (UPF0339 family)
MATRFEVTLEAPDHFCFVLRSATGEVLLTGLSGTSKIMVQNEIQHARKAVREPERIVPHEADDGAHFLVLKDQDGSVLAKSPRLDSASGLEALATSIRTSAENAPVLDLTKRSAARVPR